MLDCSASDCMNSTEVCLSPWRDRACPHMSAQETCGTMHGVGVQVLEHYVRCSRTNNHTTREAACTCIAELVTKIDAEAVRPHVAVMLRTLITCLRDDSWPVSHRLHKTSVLKCL